MEQPAVVVGGRRRNFPHRLMHGQVVASPFESSNHMEHQGVNSVVHPRLIFTGIGKLREQEKDLVQVFQDAFLLQDHDAVARKIAARIRHEYAFKRDLFVGVEGIKRRTHAWGSMIVMRVERPM